MSISMTGKREMTLSELVEHLPESHKARKEYQELTIYNGSENVCASANRTRSMMMSLSLIVFGLSGIGFCFSLVVGCTLPVTILIGLISVFLIFNAFVWTKI